MAAFLKIIYSRTFQTFHTKLLSPSQPSLRHQQRSYRSGSFDGRKTELAQLPRLKSEYARNGLYFVSTLLGLAIGGYYVGDKIDDKFFSYKVGGCRFPSNFPATQELIERAEKLRKHDLELAKAARQMGIQNFSLSLEVDRYRSLKVTYKFQVPRSCKIQDLVGFLVSYLGVSDDGDVGSNMILRAKESKAGWQLTLNYPKKLHGIGWSWMQNKDGANGGLFIRMSRPNKSADGAVVEFTTQDVPTDKERKALNSVLILAAEHEGMTKAMKLYGVRVFTSGDPTSDFSYDNIADRNQEKRSILVLSFRMSLSEMSEACKQAKHSSVSKAHEDDDKGSLPPLL